MTIWFESIQDPSHDLNLIYKFCLFILKLLFCLFHSITIIIIIMMVLILIRIFNLNWVHQRSIMCCWWYYSVLVCSIQVYPSICQCPLVLLLRTHISNNIYLIENVTLISNCVGYVPSPSVVYDFFLHFDPNGSDINKLTSYNYVHYSNINSIIIIIIIVLQFIEFNRWIFWYIPCDNINNNSFNSFGTSICNQMWRNLLLHLLLYLLLLLILH